LLRQHALPGLLAESEQELVEVGIIERAGDRVRVEAEQPQRETGKFPVAEMRGDNQRRPASGHRADDLVAADKRRLGAPVSDGQLLRQGGDLDDERKKVTERGANEPIALAVVNFREGVTKIVVGDPAVTAIDVVGK